MSGLLRILKGRLFVVGAVLVLQLTWILITVFKISGYHVYISAAFTVVGFGLVIYLTQQWKDPAYKLLWSILIMGVPLVGCVCYFLFGRVKDVSIYMRRYRTARDRLDTYGDAGSDRTEELRETDESAFRQVSYLSGGCGYPLYGRTASEYFPDGTAWFESLCRAVQSAQRFVFLEYFIICSGEMWDRLLGILRERAENGVEVRVIYDDFGSYRLPSRYREILESYGIHGRCFNRLRPILSGIVNNRDHRKIAVIDGKIAFTGGINLADEYIHRKDRFGFWKDCGIRLDGEAASGFTRMFLEMWSACGPKGEQKEDDSRFFVPDAGAECREPDPGYVQPYADNPLDAEFIGANVYLNLIHYAVKYVYFFTPYLILDEEILRALILAAKNGVDVRIVTPHIPDKKLIFMVTRSYYQQLLAAGVRIYEFTPGFLHSKCCICDGKLAVVGSINLDYRSFYLHFEDGVLLYRAPAVRQMEEDFRETFGQSEEIPRDRPWKLPLGQRLAAMLLRLVAPMF